MFERSRVLLEEYYYLMLSKGIPKRAEHMLHEVRVRLLTLHWLHARLVELDRKLEREYRELERESRESKQPGAAEPDFVKVIYTNMARPTYPGYEAAKLPFTTPDELRLLLEAFYYSAHRVRDIFRDSAAELPGLSKFEAAGIRNVRNHLVQHPGGPSGVLVYSFAVGGPLGPQLKPITWSGDPLGTQDQGLHRNAEEFEGALNATLDRAINDIRSALEPA